MDLIDFIVNREMSSSTNHYKVLEIESFASLSDITTAYRRMAMKWHPDRHLNESKAHAEHKFKEVQFAYEILSDQQKRRSYDQTRNVNKAAFDANEFGFADKKTTQSTHQPHKQPFGKPNTNGAWDANQAAQKGKDVSKVLTLSVEDAINGCKYSIEEPYLEICSGCRNAGGYKFRCQKCHGTGSITENRKFVANCTNCDGFGFKNVVCDTCGGEGGKRKLHSFTINIPSGVVNGDGLIIPGRGKESKHGGLNGDLHITIKIKQTGDWKYNNADIHGLLKVGFGTAMLGGPVEVDIPTGKTLLVTIPPRTHAGKRIRLKGNGLRKGSLNEYGDVILSVIIDLPSGDVKISPELESLLRSM